MQLMMDKGEQEIPDVGEGAQELFLSRTIGDARSQIGALPALIVKTQPRPT